MQRGCNATAVGIAPPTRRHHRRLGPPKGSWALLRMLAENKGCDWSPFATVADNRQKDSHRIQDDAGTGEYYPSRFREDLKKLILELQRLR